MPIVLPHLRDETLGNYTAPSKSYLLSYDSVPIPRALPLPDYILLVGSYKHCSELMRFLQSSRPAKPEENAGNGKSSLLGFSAPLQMHESGSDTAAGSWRDHLLRPSEYNSLLVGLIKNDRNDRRDLWQVVTAQVDGGQPRKGHYINLALFYANHRALEELLYNNWSVDPPKYFPIASPRSLALKLRAFPELTLPAPGIAWDKMRRKYGTKPNPVQKHEFEESFKATFLFQAESLDLCLEVMTNWNATISKFWPALESLWFLFGCFVIYFGVIPPVFARFAYPGREFSLYGRWATMYIWAITASTLPSLSSLLCVKLVWARPSSWPMGTWLHLASKATLFVYNHFSILIFMAAVDREQYFAFSVASFVIIFMEFMVVVGVFLSWLFTPKKMKRYWQGVY